MLEKLKRGWTRVAFGDVVRLCRERSSRPVENGFDRYVGLEHLSPGDLKIRQWGNAADGTTFTNVFRAGHVLFGKRRAYQRKLAVADFDGVCSGDIYVLESADSKSLLPELLPFICLTDRFFEYAIGTSAGSLSPRTNWSSLAKFEFALPPLYEQRRIAEVLGACCSLTERLHLSLEALERLGLSFGADVLSRSNCPTCRISDIARFRSGDGILVSQLPKARSGENPVPVLGGNGIAGYTTTPMDAVPHQTIVIGRVGEYCGAVHLVNEPAWVSDNALFMSELKKPADVGYVALCLTGLRLNRFRSGGAQPLVNQQIVGNLVIPFPPVVTQREVVVQQETIVACRKAVKRKMCAARQLASELMGMMECVR
ncbi:MAG: restriction endonuclease subunit S [Acidobacteriota bacterium]|nr:restriction endonuclease subunit S [Acidobacteriota bacterium]